jgi:hypothetical protein
MTVFPEAATVDVPSTLASDLLDAARAAPPAVAADYYDTTRQSRARDEIRAGCPDGFDRLVTEIRACLVTPPFSALVRGLEYDDSHRVFVAVCRSLGELISPPRDHNPRRAQLLHFIRPAEDLKAASGQALTERLHTDAADWPEPPAVIAMICVRPDPMGLGRSRLLDVVSLRRAIEQELGARALTLLEQETVPWQLAAYCGGGKRWRTVLKDSSICWRRYTIDLALESDGTWLSNEVLTSLDSIEDVISTTTRTVDFLMAEGDLLFSDNTRTIHGRTPIADGDASGRLLETEIPRWVERGGLQGVRHDEDVLDRDVVAAVQAARDQVDHRPRQRLAAAEDLIERDPLRRRRRAGERP